MKSPILCRMGLHKLNKYTYVQVTRRRSNRHGGKITQITQSVNGAENSVTGCGYSRGRKHKNYGGS